MNQYIFSKLKCLVDIKMAKNIRADDFRLKWIKQAGINKLRHATEIVQYQTELEIKKMSKTAYTFADFNL